MRSVSQNTGRNTPKIGASPLQCLASACKLYVCFLSEHTFLIPNLWHCLILSYLKNNYGHGLISGRNVVSKPTSELPQFLASSSTHTLRVRIVLKFKHESLLAVNFILIHCLTLSFIPTNNSTFFFNAPMSSFSFLFITKDGLQIRFSVEQLLILWIKISVQIPTYIAAR